MPFFKKEHSHFLRLIKKGIDRLKFREIYFMKSNGKKNEKTNLAYQANTKIHEFRLD